MEGAGQQVSSWGAWRIAPENECEEREEPCMNLERIREIAEGELLGKRSHPWKEPGNKFHHGECAVRCGGEQMRRNGRNRA